MQPQNNQNGKEFDQGHGKIRIVDRFPINQERIKQQHDKTFDKKMDDKFSKLSIERQKSSERILQGMISPLRVGECQHNRWLQHVKRLKHVKTSFNDKSKKPNDKISNQSKRLQPFGNFLKDKNCIGQHQSTKSLGSGRRVTFNIPDEQNGHNFFPQSTSASNQTLSCGNSKINEPEKELQRLDDKHSLHKCKRSTIKSSADKRFIEKCYWTKKDFDRTMARTQHRANTFRSDHPATVKQLCRTFLDICNQGTGTYSKDRILHGDAEAEEQEELLRDFLRHWAASNVRGLEELVTGRNMFTDTRKMAVQSVLAYQQTLRESGSGNDTTTANCNSSSSNSIERDRVAGLLRARSESTSHRSRMFAMYLALGDALVANGSNNESECNSSLDDADISINME